MTEPKYAWRRTEIATGDTKHWDSTPSAKPNSNSKEPFVMVYQAACRSIATNYELQGFDLRLFIFLQSILEMDNWVDVHHTGIARQMSTEDHKISRPQVSASLAKLVAAGMILKGVERTYRIHPGVAWKGDAPSQAKAEQDAAKGRLALVRP